MELLTAARIIFFTLGFLKAFKSRLSTLYAIDGSMLQRAITIRIETAKLRKKTRKKFFYRA